MAFPTGEAKNMVLVRMALVPLRGARLSRLGALACGRACCCAVADREGKALPDHKDAACG